MLIESTGIRNLLNFNPSKASIDRPADGQFSDGENQESGWKPPQSYKISMNPIPALMVLLLGVMMSSHHQSSMVSTMIHKQWGTLLMGASLARGLTYIIFYLSPPTSFLPSRPPSELITAFCLMAGGLVFMASVRILIYITLLYRGGSNFYIRAVIQLYQWNIITWMPCLYSP